MNRRKFIKTIYFGIMGITMFPFFKNFYKRDMLSYVITPGGPGKMDRWVLQGNIEPDMSAYKFVEYRKIKLKEIVKAFKIPKSILLR